MNFNQIAEIARASNVTFSPVSTAGGLKQMKVGAYLITQTRGKLMFNVTVCGRVQRVYGDGSPVKYFTIEEAFRACVRDSTANRNLFGIWKVVDVEGFEYAKGSQDECEDYCFSYDMKYRFDHDTKTVFII